MAGLSLQHIWKKYPNGFEAVKDFNLEIEDKEFIIFVGPSGCGKSTTLRMIAGLEDISEGVLKIGDRVVNDVESKDRDIAMVFQNYALYPHMTVAANMGFALKLQKVPKPEIDKAVQEEVKSHKMKTELITNVSHDLKTPLTAIITYVNLLKEKNLTPEQREQYVDTLDKKSLRLKRLIEDLFEVSKANSGNVQLNLQNCDLVNLIKQCFYEVDRKSVV